MAQNYYDGWKEKSWEQWSWEQAAKKFGSTMGRLQERCDWLRKECDWLHKVVGEQREEMKRLDTEVAALGQENKELTQRVSELEGVNAGSARTIGSARTSDSEEESPVRIAADASVAGVSEIPKEVPVVGERQRQRAIEWKHPEAKGGARATSRGGPCNNCHGGMVLDPEEEQTLKEMWHDYPQKIWPWVSHLGSTLFSTRGTRHWSDIEKKLTKREGRFLVWGSTKKNSREFVCQCGECEAIVTAKYAVNDEEDCQNARDTLAKFVIGREAEDSKRT